MTRWNEFPEQTFFLHAESPGWYGWELHYVAEEQSSCSLLLDGDFQGWISLERGAHIHTTPAMRLEQGSHQLTVKLNWGRGRVESAACKSMPPLRYMPRFRLSNPKALPACREVMALLERIHGRRMLAGQHVNGGDGDLQRLEQLSGDLPAIMGFDMMSFSSACFPKERTPACVEEVCNNLGSIDRALYWGRERGALISLCWHWYSPTDGWDKSFYTKNTSFSLSEALRTRDARYERLIADIDLIAAQLQRLQEAEVPVLWRPLHEAAGRWFWWGASGAESYIALYRLMYDRLTRVHGLNHLIWVWNAPEPGWFPGEDVVDIAAMDIYAPPGNHGEMALEFARGVEAMAGSPLPLALGEVGVAPDVTKILRREVPWLWFMLWSGFPRMEDQNPSDQLGRILTHPAVMLLRDYQTMLSDMRKEKGA